MPQRHDRHQHPQAQRYGRGWVRHPNRHSMAGTLPYSTVDHRRHGSRVLGLAFLFVRVLPCRDSMCYNRYHRVYVRSTVCYPSHVFTNKARPISLRRYCMYFGKRIAGKLHGRFDEMRYLLESELRNSIEQHWRGNDREFRRLCGKLTIRMATESYPLIQ